MLSLGPTEIAFFLGIVLLLFGPDKIPQIAKSVGKATKEYQKALKEVTDSGDSMISQLKGGDSTSSDSKGVSSSTNTSSQEPKTVNREKAIIEQAQLLGINTNGKTIDQIVDEILSRN